jgi:Bacterial virulence factor lipase N-terminal
MQPNFLRSWSTAAVLALCTPLAMADAVRVRFDAGLGNSPFPSNRYTVFDGTQNTLRRMKLPKPDCAVRVSDCQDIDVINTLDGFSIQPRITVPFTGDINPSTVNSNTVYLVNLGDTLSLRGFGERVGINQVLWDPATKTLVMQSDQLLQQHSRYVLVITDGIRDVNGNKIKGGRDDDDDDDNDRFASSEYRSEVRDGLQSLRGGGNRVVASSVFTTQSVSADLRKINKQIKASSPAALDFMIGAAANGKVRAVFPLASLTGIQFSRQTGALPLFTNSAVPVGALSVAPGAVARVAYARFSSPDYETPAKLIPATGTLTGTPQVQGKNDLVVQMFLPTGAKPAAGWPVAIFGHGFGDSMYGAPWTVAATLASQGIATLSINVVGHGGGALGTLNVQTSAGVVSVPAGGRGIDQDGNGSIDGTEGSSAVGANNIIASRDGLRQTVVDLMQLVRQIEAGVDVDGDGSVDLDKNRIYYSGQSFGGIYGTIFLGVEPNIKAGVPNVPGGSIIEIVRLSPVFRFLGAIALVSRQPSLINLPPTPGVAFPFNLNFFENMPLRDLPPVVNSTPGALAIADLFDRTQWVSAAGNPVSYAPYIRKQPLPGNAAKPVIFQFAKGDQTVPNPTTSAILRAGGFADRATYFRNDLAYANNNAVGKNPHTFLTNIGGPATVGYALAAQKQIATFFASGGVTTIDPDAGAGPYFEVPINGALPEGLNYIP